MRSVDVQLSSDNCYRKESENEILNCLVGLDKIGEKEAFLKAMEFCVDRR